jgi:hypothetical protein
MIDIEMIINKLKEQNAELLTQEEKDALKSIINQNSIHDFLSRINIEDIELKREAFQTLNIKKLTDEDLFNAVMDTISFDPDGSGKKISILTPRSVLYSSGTRFYRIRKLEKDDNCLPLKALKKEQDAWNAPAENCKLGRLNAAGESLLYTSVQSPNVCVEEMDVKDEDLFCLMVYEAIKEIKVTLIGLWQDNEQLSKDENLKMRMITNVLSDLFTRDVGKGTEFLYRVSGRIAKVYYDLPRECQDAWCYPSVAAKQGRNCCFRPEVAKEVLKLVGVQICSVKRDAENYMYNCRCISVWNNEKEQFDYYSVDSPICRKLFPEIMIP